MYMTHSRRYAVIQDVKDRDLTSCWVTLWYMPHGRIHSTMYGLDGLRAIEMPRNWSFCPCT